MGTKESKRDAGVRRNPLQSPSQGWVQVQPKAGCRRRECRPTVCSFPDPRGAPGEGSSVSHPHPSRLHPLRLCDLPLQPASQAAAPGTSSVSPAAAWVTSTEEECFFPASPWELCLPVAKLTRPLLGLGSQSCVPFLRGRSCHLLTLSHHLEKSPDADPPEQVLSCTR